LSPEEKLTKDSSRDLGLKRTDIIILPLVEILGGLVASIGL
jgi:hypothetical protein